MTLFTVGQTAVAVWGADKKEYDVTIEHVNSNGKWVSIRWNNTTSEGKQLFTATFPIESLKKIDSEEDVPGCPGRFEDPENVDEHGANGDY